MSSPRLRRALLCALVTVAACGGDSAPSPTTPTTPTTPTIPSPSVDAASRFVAGAPTGWAGGGVGYETGVDEGVRRSGARSGSIRATGASGATFGALSQAVRSDAYRGRRVRLTAMVRSHGAATASGSGGGVWLRVDGTDASVVLDNTSNRWLTGTTDWTPMSIVVDVPNNALGLTLGALLAGPGQLWVDDLQLETVGTDVPVTAPAQPGTTWDAATQASVASTYARSRTAPVNMGFDGIALDPLTVDWLRGRAVPFAGTTPDGATADLAPLRAMVGSARLVALGEGTHGTRDFFQMKHRVLQYLVQELGFTAFAIEATWPEANAVNEYVLNGTGDPAVLLSNLYFWTWNTQEVLDMIRWMRTYNTTAAPNRRVQFFGFDMQSPGAAIDSVLAFVARVDPPQTATVNAAYACLTPYRNRGSAPATRQYATATAAERTACGRSVADAYDLVAAGRAAYVAASSPAVYARTLQSARLVVQWEDMARNSATALAVAARDRYMAENVTWLLGQLPAGARMTLWAHNAHVSEVAGWMGSYLAGLYGADYVAAGFAFGDGSFNAVTLLPNGGFGTLTSHTVRDILPGSVEAYAEATGLPRFILDTRAIPGAAAAAPLAGPISMRSIGSGFSPTADLGTFYQATSLSSDYDLLIFVRSTSASVLLPFRY